MNPLILGVPRSGTSLCANLLTHMGFDFTCNNNIDHDTIDSYFPSLFNIDGYFQRFSLFSFLSGVLQNDFDCFETSCIFSERQRRHFRTIFRSIQNAHPLWAIKEPYLIRCLTELEQFPLVYIIVHRNPTDTLQSIQRMQKQIPNTSVYTFNKWQQYYLTFARWHAAHPNLPVIFLSYDQLIQNPIKTYDIFFKQLSAYMPNLNYLTPDVLRKIIRTK